MEEQLKIVVSGMPSWSDYRYRIAMHDARGALRYKRHYKSSRAALKCIDLWRAAGHTIEELELNKIAE